MDDRKIVGYDLSTPSLDGSDKVTIYLLELLNSYPELGGEEIVFQNVEGTAKISMVPTSSVAILTEKIDIVGHVKQKCQYSFQIFRTARGLNEVQKIRYKEWLDHFADWLQKIEYPPMGEGKKMVSIQPSDLSLLYATSDGKSEAWAIPITATYDYEFDKK